MFAHDLYHSQIEHLNNSIDLNRKDKAKRYHKSSIFNSGLSGLGISPRPSAVAAVFKGTVSRKHCWILMGNFYHVTSNFVKVLSGALQGHDI